MADDGFNSMQAQLGLVGQGGSFNPLGIATPPPPPAPMVRHPGDVSQDIVRQTQTAMATTLQTTSAMRLGGMGGIAFGGGGGGGGGVGAIGAFAQQYQQNMAGINAQHVAPFSAQMMGMMGGMGGGFQPGMLPNPAMMTTPGMGIYRPFMPPQAPTVSPFPQMPVFPTPFTPMPPPAQFQTPMELSNNIAIQAGQRRTAAMFATPGVMARAGADIGLGYMGAGVGASLGARFGPGGALIGGGIGALAGAMGSEHFGLGAAAQHMTERLNPFRTMAIRGQQMMGASQEFVTGGPDLNVTGRGLSMKGATHLGRMLEDTAFSTSFKRQTGGAFSAQDLTKITQVAGQQGMMNDAQSVEAIHDRVKNIAKSLVSFMKIANEPNVVEALKSMGKMRQMGLSVAETMDAAVDARMFARMAGTTSKGIMESGGMPGAMMFQQQGLSAGLGMRVGMGAVGMANAAVAGGAYTPQRLAMLGGVQGVAQHEMESSAAFLKMPMMAAAMSQMGRGGEFGVSGGAVQALRSGNINIGGMATTGANNMLDAVRKQGVGALGMMQVQGSEIQDQVGRLLGPQGLQAAKMQQVMQTMNMMGLDKNPGGFATAALAMGMSNDQVKSMMSQANSPGYWKNMQQQNRVEQMEVRGLAAEERERNRPGVWANMTRMGSGATSRALGDAYAGMRNFGESVSTFFGTDEQERQATERGQVVLRTDRSLLTRDDRELRDVMGMSASDAARSRRERAAIRAMPGRASERNRRVGVEDFNFGSTSDWEKITGGDSETRALRARRAGGWQAALGGGIMEGALNTIGALGASAIDLVTFGQSGLQVRDLEEEGRMEDREKKAGSDMWKEGLQYQSTEEYGKAVGELGKTKDKEGKERGSVKMARVAALVSLRLTSKAREDRNWVLRNEQMGGEAANKEIMAALREEGIDPSEVDAATMKKLGALGSVGVAQASGNEAATAAEDAPDIKTHKEFIDQSKQDMERLTDEMFGKEGRGMDIFGGTQTRRMALTEKIFGKGRSGKGGMLAALKAAAEGPNSTPEAKEAYLQARSAAVASGDTKVLEEMKATEADIGQGSESEMAAMGRRFGAMTEKEREAAIAGEARGYKGTKRDIIEAAGRRLTFGEGSSPTADIGDLLQGDTSKMSEGMRDIAKRYQRAKLERDEGAAETIKEEASREALTQGVGMEAETAGGIAGASDKMYEQRRETMGKAEKDVGGAFPRAVDTFSEASRSMLEAARLLKSGGGRPTLSPDVNLAG